METSNRVNELLQRHFSSELSDDEAVELKSILVNDTHALDLYLDLCDIDECLLSADSIPQPSRNWDQVPKSSVSRHGSYFAITGICAILCVVIALPFLWRFDGVRNDVELIADNGAVTSFSESDTPIINRRVPNPWKVISSTGSMNHPRIHESSIPNFGNSSGRVSFNKDIKPILSETCFHCHGPDERGRRADLRLDTIEGATQQRGDLVAIMPHNASNSEVWRRITNSDPNLMMPPLESHLVLTDDQKSLLKRWIDEGAVYEGHWSFTAPTSPAVPKINFTDESKGTHWVRNPIDSFIAEKLVAANMAPAAEADPRTLIRRLSLDLTGLPPTVGDVEKFVKDFRNRGDAAYQELVTRLLDSNHFGERMAVSWLDQARYADTNGYSIDGGRHMWLWRDWVIQAYNDNMPFDQFLMEQLAGDLMPERTDAQLIATGFNRNHMITHEGGTIPEENLVNYAADRTKTTAEVFLGLTVGCAQCHDHKYDPISQQEYYQLYAFFNQLDENGLDGDWGQNAAPSISAKTVLRTDEIETLDKDLEILQRELETSREGFDEWLDQQRNKEMARGIDFEFVESQMLAVSSPNETYSFEPDNSVKPPRQEGGLVSVSHSIRLQSDATSDGTMVSGVRIEFLPERVDGEGEEKLALTPFNDGVPKISTVLVSATAQPTDQVDYHRQLNYSKVTASSHADGHGIETILDESNVKCWQPNQKNEPQHITLTFSNPVSVEDTPYISVLVVFGTSQSMPFHWRVRPFSGNDPDSQWSEDVINTINTPEEEWDTQSREKVLTAFRDSADSLAPLRLRIANLQDRRNVLTANHSAMVMNTKQNPRETFVLERGQYNSPTIRVLPGTPSVLPQLFSSPAREEEQSTNVTRLDLAKWLVRPDHPLTSRVAVNRFWKLFFGTGIVATSADFGSQGEFPSHPELLDYLATHFIEIEWDQKQLIREIVSSATYRQESSADSYQLEIDPMNRLLGRGPRFRLPAEFIRDQALSVSGLLVPRIGGPSVQPYQPPGLWKEVSHFGSTPATKQVYIQDHGEGLYRRSLYTVVKRSSPHPAMMAFDAPNRETCTVDRGVTITPLQALVTLNDPQFSEAARVIAQRLLEDRTLTDDRERLERAFEMVLSRAPNTVELQAVMNLLRAERNRYSHSPESAKASISVGEAPRASRIDPVEQAALMQAVTLLLNLSEALTRQ